MMMDESVNFVKGYRKVNPSENEAAGLYHRQYQQETATRKRRVAVAVSLIVLLTVVAGAMVAALIYESVTEPPESDEAIKSVCSVTRYPDSCFTNISSINTSKEPDPEQIFNLSLQIAFDAVANLSSLPGVLISKSNDPGTESALHDCATLFRDAVSQLNNSVGLMRVGPGEKVMTEEKIGDLKTWISAAMTDQETCLDGLEEMKSTAGDELKVKMQRSEECMSNSLAILASMDNLLRKFCLKMH